MPRNHRAPKGRGLPSSIEITNAKTDTKDVYKNEVTGYIFGEWVDHVKDLPKVPAATRELTSPGFNLSKFGATVCGVKKLNGHLCGHTIAEGGSGQMRRHLEEKHGIKVNANSRSQVNEDEIFAGIRGLIRMILHREWHEMPFWRSPSVPWVLMTLPTFLPSILTRRLRKMRISLRARGDSFIAL